MIINSPNKCSILEPFPHAILDEAVHQLAIWMENNFLNKKNNNRDLLFSTKMNAMIFYDIGLLNSETN